MENILLTALISLCSGVVSSLLTLYFTLNKDLISIKRDRLEQYVHAIADCENIQGDMADHYLFDCDRKISDSPLAKLETLTILYFEKVESPFWAFKHSITKSKIYLMECRQQRLKDATILNDAIKLGLPTTEMTSALPIQTQSFLDSKDVLLNELKKHYPLLSNNGKLSNLSVNPFQKLKKFLR